MTNANPTASRERCGERFALEALDVTATGYVCRGCMVERARVAAVEVLDCRCGRCGALVEAAPYVNGSADVLCVDCHVAVTAAPPAERDRGHLIERGQREDRRRRGGGSRPRSCCSEGSA